MSEIVPQNVGLEKPHYRFHCRERFIVLFSIQEIIEENQQHLLDSWHEYFDG
jgi:hypothetical protein